MTSTPLDRLLATAQEYNASDLHIIAGVPPAFRVNGEIILAESAPRTLALTPALSPRRGGANMANFGTQSFAASGHAAYAEEFSRNTGVAAAFPLLGEKAGVRADQRFEISMKRWCLQSLKRVGALFPP